MSSNIAVPSFPFPPSPTHTNSTTSSWIHPDTSTQQWSQSTPSQCTSRSHSLSSLASSASFPISPAIQVNLPSATKAEPFDFGAIGQTNRVRHFGEGWKSTLMNNLGEEMGQEQAVEINNAPRTPPMTTAFLDDSSNTTPVARNRIRNPSLPILPSQGILRNALGLKDNLAHMPDFESLSLFDSPSRTKVQPRSDDLFSPHHLQPEQGYLDARYIPRLAPRTPTLIHHQSVPNLDRVPRRRGSVRFADELLAYDDEEEISPRSWRLLTSSAETKRRNVYIHSLPCHITEHAIRAYAEGFGQVLSMRVAVDDSKGLDRFDGRRHAFVMFETNDQAGGFMAAIQARGIPCEYAKEDWQTEYKAREDRFSSNIYVVGLPLDWSKEEVEEYMTQFGRVASLRLLEDKDGNRRGPVLIRFDSRPQAERAINILNGQTHPGTGERVQARIADSDGQKDYKKLRTTTSADLLLDDRNAPSMDSADDVNYLVSVREKYARQLQYLDAQISAAATADQGHPPTQPRYTPTLNAFISPSAPYSHNLPTPPNCAFALPTSPYSVGTPPQQTWRQRQLSSSGAYTPWTDTSPTYLHHHDRSAPPPTEYAFAPYAFSSRSHAVPPSVSYSNSQWTPEQRQSFSYRPTSSQFEMGLHHAKSTPELGRDPTAKLLWPN